MALDFYVDDLGRLIFRFLDHYEKKNYYQKHREKILEQKAVKTYSNDLKLIGSDDRIHFDTFIFMTGADKRKVVQYCNENKIKVLKRIDGWWLPESLFKVFKPIKTLAEV